MKYWRISADYFEVSKHISYEFICLTQQLEFCASGFSMIPITQLLLIDSWMNRLIAKNVELCVIVMTFPLTISSIRQQEFCLHKNVLINFYDLFLESYHLLILFFIRLYLRFKITIQIISLFNGDFPLYCQQLWPPSSAHPISQFAPKLQLRGNHSIKY